MNILGVPFTFLPHEEGDGPPPPPPSPKTKIQPVPEKREFAISWPNVIRIDHVYRPRLRSRASSASESGAAESV